MKAIIVFIKNPELGKVKTRLARTIGDDHALKIYKYLLQYTKDVVKNVSADQLFLFHGGKLIDSNKWSILNCDNRLQNEGDLGVKMDSAFRYVFSKGFDKAVLIGSDCLEIKLEHIESSFSKLERADIVIGPAEDGGYYLLGMNKYNSSLFRNMPWSTNNLLEKTIEVAIAECLNYKLLPVLSDVDYIEDLEGKLDWKKL